MSRYPGMDFIASNISSSDIFTGHEPKAVLRTSFFNGLHPFVPYSSIPKGPEHRHRLIHILVTLTRIATCAL